MNLDRVISIEDLRQLTRAYLPRVLFDFLDGGAGDENSLTRNISQFTKLRFIPRYFVDVSNRDLRMKVFNRMYKSPFGIAPTGFAGLFRPKADLLLAEAAKDSDIPFVLSGASCSSVESAAKTAPNHAWYQLFAAKDPKIWLDLARRVCDAGIETLVITVDLPVRAKRERDIRNGFNLPLKITPLLVLDVLRHPRWMWNYLRSGGTPFLENWLPYAGQGATPTDVAMLVDHHAYAAYSWADLETLRALWPGTLVVKGILHPQDAVTVADLGADGIIVSNHGGRQFDRAVTSIEALPGIVARVGHRLTVMVDGGIRCGADIVGALCLGAKFCFVGRSTLYGVAAAGALGAKKAIDILNNDIDVVLAQLGCTSIQELGPQLIFESSALYS